LSPPPTPKTLGFTAPYPFPNFAGKSYCHDALRMKEVAHNLLETLINVVGTLVWVTRYSANGRSLTTWQAFAEFPLSFLLVKSDVRVTTGENLYENFRLFEPKFCWYGADAILFSGHCACRDGKRLRRTRRLLRKSYSQRRASELLGNDSGSSQISIRHAGECMSQRMRHSSH
jgi:hypothetical protein